MVNKKNTRRRHPLAGIMCTLDDVHCCFQLICGLGLKVKIVCDITHKRQSNSARMKQCSRAESAVVDFSVLTILGFTNKTSCSIFKTAASQQAKGQFKGLDILINFNGLPQAIHLQLLGHSLCFASFLF